MSANVRVLYAMAQESYARMKRFLSIYRKPRGGGQTGFINRVDPEQKSFKCALVTIVFCGMFLESVLYILIVQREGVDVFRKHDRRTYEQKLRLLGCRDESVIGQCEHLRRIRRQIVHEKAFIDTDRSRIAQHEAEAAVAAIDSVVSHFGLAMES